MSRNLNEMTFAASAAIRIPIRIEKVAPNDYQTHRAIDIQKVFAIRGELANVCHIQTILESQSRVK
jgi:hypothetical protein